MRVLQVNLDDSAGGVFSYVYQLQKALAERIIFDYYSMSSFNNQQVVSSIQSMQGKVIGADLRKNRFIGHLNLPFHFFRFLKKNPYKVIHIHSDTAWKLLIYAIPAKLAGIKKIIVHAHSSNINGDHRMLKLFCHRMAKPIVPLFADIYCACSDFAAKWMYPDRLLAKVVFMKNGIDTEKYKFNDQERKNIRTQLGMADGDFVIGTVGNFSYQKNPGYIIKVFEEFYSMRSSSKLLFVGDGADRSRVEKEIAAKEYKNNVIFYGYTREVHKVLNAFDVFILPSRFEGFPVCAVEAQANGLPCVLSDTITKQCKLSEKCVFMNLSDMPARWAEKLRNYAQVPINRDEGQINVLEQGFDVRQTTEALYKVYSS